MYSKVQNNQTVESKKWSQNLITEKGHIFQMSLLELQYYQYHSTEWPEIFILNILYDII